MTAEEQKYKYKRKYIHSDGTKWVQLEGRYRTGVKGEGLVWIEKKLLSQTDYKKTRLLRSGVLYMYVKDFSIIRGEIYKDVTIIPESEYEKYKLDFPDRLKKAKEDIAAETERLSNEICAKEKEQDERISKMFTATSHREYYVKSTP